MTRRPSTITQSAVTRALKAAKAAGLDLSRVEITSDGKIILITGKPDENQSHSAAKEEIIL